MKRFIFLLFCLCLAVASAHADLRVLAFGDSNTWGWKPMGGGTRFADAERWTGVLQTELADEAKVITDGLVARRTDLDGLDTKHISGSFLNGAHTLPAAIARNVPLDLVIIFLGTNDLQRGAERSAEEIAQAVAGLADLALTSSNLLYAQYEAPKQVLVVIPPTLRNLDDSPLKGLFEVGLEASQNLMSAFNALPSQDGVAYIAFDLISPNGIGADGIHLNETGHQELGKAIADWVKENLE